DLRRALGVAHGGLGPGVRIRIATSGEGLGSEGRGGREEEEQEFDVDRILGNQPLMVMAPGELLEGLRFIEGVGVMDDGRVAVLLDPMRLPGMFRSKKDEGSKDGRDDWI
ncbi:MAG: hypothetical protein JRJ29_18985, partial [Deltaproteobacteria bacterium]|nr:hypothetical protein [Deltaproteobacteria bacterium]